jgi:multiple sugar transport system substrate-binding protein
MKKEKKRNGRKNAKSGGALLLGLIVILAWWWTAQSGASGDLEQGVLDVWTTWGDAPKSLQGFFDEYTHEEGVGVNVSSQIRLDKLQEALTSTQVPDLVILTGAEPVPGFAEMGWVEPLDPSLDITQMDVRDLLPTTLDPCVDRNGGLICLPWGFDIDVLYWNKSLFAAAGLDPDRPPQTIEELIQYTDRLTERDDDGRLTRVGFIPGFPAQRNGLQAWWLQEMTASEETANQQTSVIGQDTHEGWEDPFAEIFNQDELKDFISTFTPYMSSSHPIYAEQRLNCWQCHRSTDFDKKKLPYGGFFDGHVAMMIDGSWHALGGWEGKNRLPENFGAVPMTVMSSEGRLDASTITGPVVIIPSGAADKEAALQLVSWMMSPEKIAEASFMNGSLPSTRTATSDPLLQPSALVQDVFGLMLEQDR